jgi:thioredoxin reductase
MADHSTNATDVLERMAVVGNPDIFVLGCRARRVTVLSQQYRAFNLIWALMQLGRLQEGDRIGVIGGGIGGLTAAAAAMLKGCEVIVAEQRPDLMHLQRQSETRFLHPFMYEWPNEVAEQQSTKFPCMNWEADTAGRVVTALDREWNGIAGQYPTTIRKQTKITSLPRDIPTGGIILQGETFRSEPCKLVILAVGFGVETTFSGVAPLSYWDNDNLAQPIKGSDAKRRFFVSGIGDGGCIDVLRLTYQNFNHSTFITRMMRLSALTALRERLLEIDSNMPSVGQSNYLHEAYSALPFPGNLARTLGAIRPDTYVELNGQDPYPYSTKACILHRVALWALNAAGHLNYRARRLDVDRIQPSKGQSGLTYAVPGEGGSDTFDFVVLRHGPRSQLEIFPEISAGHSAASDSYVVDPTRWQMYPEGFYPKSPVQADVSATTSPTLLADMPVPDPTPTTPPPLIHLSESNALAQQQVTVHPVAFNSVREATIEASLAALQTTMQENNFAKSRDASNLLESLVTEPGAPISRSLLIRANRELFDFEMRAQQRARIEGEAVDSERLRALIDRIQHDTR